ncbi:MAG: VacJ family lipoprotein [Pseudomonadales bacterium]|nr:VacJ family lipoprotein [Pseudomonadales bacterium]
MTVIDKLPTGLKLVFLSVITAACTSIPSEDSRQSGTTDPLEEVNRLSYALTEEVDNYVLKPMAQTHTRYTPGLIRSGITNFFNNLFYPNVILNSLLQGKIQQTFSDASRFIVNTTAGLGGVLDVGSPIGLPAHDEDFGQTLAVWGVGQGAYLYLPLLGPGSARELPDRLVSTYLNPLIYIDFSIAFPLGLVYAVNRRANLLRETTLRDESAVDPYSFTREAYLQQRQFLIHDGDPPTTEYESLFDLDE